MKAEDDPERVEFYTKLIFDLNTERKSITALRGIKGASDQCEYKHLDQDCGTKKIEPWTTRQWRTSLIRKEAW